MDKNDNPRPMTDAAVTGQVLARSIISKVLNGAFRELQWENHWNKTYIIKSGGRSRGEAITNLIHEADLHNSIGNVTNKPNL